jgi:hypothetical protein
LPLLEITPGNIPRAIYRPNLKRTLRLAAVGVSRFC